MSCLRDGRRLNLGRPVRRWAICCFAIVCLIIGGCDQGKYKIVPVSGTVTLDGEPVADARVIFEPQRTGQEALSAGPSSDGKTDEQGRYSLLTTSDGKSGAVVGPHSVVVTTYLAEIDRSKDTSKIIRKEEIPARYRDVGGLTFEVPAGGTDTADFSLTTKP